MKKQMLFILVICACTIAFGQNTTTTPTLGTLNKINVKPENIGVPLPKRGMNNVIPVPSGTSQQKHVVSGNHPLSTTTTADSTIGSSHYDLQTNGSICNSIVANRDGTVSTVWIMSHSNSPYSDRGTGYNYFNGLNWTLGAGAPNVGVPPTIGPQTRIEAERAGWGNIAVTGTGGEVIVSHQAPTVGSAFGLDVLTRPAKGIGLWTENVLPYDVVWPRMVVGGANGNTIHIIANTMGLGSTPLAVHGQIGSIAYFRSQDGGATWDIINGLIPQIDSSHYMGFDRDTYAMDAKGDTIAIAIGGKDVDVILLKSIDNGTTWTKTIVKQFPIPLFDPQTMYTDIANPTSSATIDTIQSNDGNMAVLLDNNGIAHVWFGNMRVVCSTPGTSTGQGLVYFPYTDGLMYWDETMSASAPFQIAKCQDVNQDGALDVYVDPTGATLGMGTYYCSLTSMPSAGIDSTGRIYLSYGSVYDGLNQSGNIPTVSNGETGKSFRHTFIMFLDAGSSVWSTPQDITDSTGQNYMEGVFGSMSRKVYGNISETVQNDNAPGDALAMTSSSTQIDPQDSDESDIVYYGLLRTTLVGNCYAYFTTNYDSTSNLFTLVVDPITMAMATGYHWDFGDGSTSTLAAPFHSYAHDTLYNVCMKIYTAAGDSCLYCHVIGRDSLGNIVRSAGFSLQVQNNTTLVVPKITSESSITIAPNPFTYQTNITFSEIQKNTTVKIMDVVGKEIKAIVLSGANTLTIEKGAMQAGMYFVQIIDDKQKVVNRKIVVQ